MTETTNVSKSKTSIQFLSQTSFLEKNALIDICKKFFQLSSNNEIKNILDYYLASDMASLSQQEMTFIKNNDKKIWVDYLIYRYKFNNYGKLRKIPQFPLYLLVEPTSICNLKCSICFQRDRSFSGSKKFMGKMDFELFAKIIDEASAGGTKALTLASRGEPTLHPLFGEMLEYCTGKFYEFKINTNALRLNSEIAHKILKSRVGMVIFSVDAYDAEGYKKIRNSSKFTQVVKNIINFHKIRTKYYPDYNVVTRAHAVKVDENFNGNQFYSFWGGIADEVTISNSVERWDTYNNNKTNNSNPCSVALDRMYIWHDGTCNPCDADYKSNLEVGNVRGDTIEEIWNGRKFETFRKIHFSGERSTLIPCDRCGL